MYENKVHEGTRMATFQYHSWTLFCYLTIVAIQADSCFLMSVPLAIQSCFWCCCVWLQTYLTQCKSACMGGRGIVRACARGCTFIALWGCTQTRFWHTTTKRLAIAGLGYLRNCLTPKELAHPSHTIKSSIASEHWQSWLGAAFCWNFAK